MMKRRAQRYQVAYFVLATILLTSFQNCGQAFTPGSVAVDSLSNSQSGAGVTPTPIHSPTPQSTPTPPPSQTPEATPSPTSTPTATATPAASPTATPPPQNGGCSATSSEIQALNGTSGPILKTVATTFTDVIGARGVRVNNGALNLALYDGYEPTAAQNFRLTKQNDCSFSIASQGACLEAPASTGNVHMVACDAASARQKWVLTRKVDSTTAVASVTLASQNGVCLSTSGGASSVGTGIVAEACQSKASQQFYLRQLSAGAEQAAGVYEKRTYRASNGRDLPYRLLLPANYNPSASYPVLLWLHQAGVSGSNNESQMNGTTAVFNQPFMRGKFPAIVLVPQNAAEDSYWENWGSNPSGSQVAVMEMLAYIRTQYNVDARRIYIGGQSDGGMGSFEFAQRWPATFAAIISLSGGGQASTASRVKDIPSFVIHGQDKWTKDSRSIVSALRAVGGSPIYTEITQSSELGYIHGDWHLIMATPGTLEWVFAQRKQ